MTCYVIKYYIIKHTKLPVISVLWQIHLKLIKYISNYSLQLNVRLYLTWLSDICHCASLIFYIILHLTLLLDRTLYSLQCIFFPKFLTFSIVYNIIEKSHQEDVTTSWTGQLESPFVFPCAWNVPLLAIPMLEAARDTALR